MIIDFSKPEHKLNDTYRTNFKTLILDCERLKQPIVFNIHDRRFLDRFRAIDCNHRSLKLNYFILSGDLIYFKFDRFNWHTLEIDMIDSIEVENAPNLDYFMEV